MAKEIKKEGKAFMVMVKKRSKLANNKAYITYQKNLYHAYDNGSSVFITTNDKNDKMVYQFIGKTADYDKAINAFVARIYPAKASWRYV